jgi:hypothetical protein
MIYCRMSPGFRLSLKHVIPKICSRAEIAAFFLVFNGALNRIFVVFLSNTAAAVGWISMLVLTFVEEAVGGVHGGH